MHKVAIKNRTENELLEFFAEINEKKYRAKQLNDALYKKKINAFSEISNFPKQLIVLLEKKFSATSLSTEKILESTDGSKKILYKTSDNQFIETVFLSNSPMAVNYSLSARNDIKEKESRSILTKRNTQMTINESRSKIAKSDFASNRHTLCVSTMVGCPINCRFCATARIGFKRNLDVAEIIDQIFLTENNTQKSIDNIVFMGMGEPFLNYSNVVNSLKIISKNEIVSKKNITVSTIGIPEKIIDFAKEEMKIKLAISLHSAFDDVRKTLIPVAKKYQIEDLLKALEYYYRATKMPITFEYILFKNLNDSEKDIKKIAKIARRFPAKINLIPFNDISFVAQNIDLIPASENEIKIFAKKLYNENVMTITRKSQGSDIAAACGQLATSVTLV